MLCPKSITFFCRFNTQHTIKYMPFSLSATFLGAGTLDFSWVSQCPQGMMITGEFSSVKSNNDAH